jgi:two-component SAPR family response regulator
MLLNAMEPFSRFIIIDDDTINNTLCSVILRRIAGNEANIQTFNIPEQGFKYIAEDSSDAISTVLFLDINMPGWSGWVFLENFERLDKEIKNKFKIYMLSSSVDPLDQERAQINKNVVDFIIKPLTKTKVLSILAENNRIEA